MNRLSPHSHGVVTLGPLLCSGRGSLEQCDLGTTRLPVGGTSTTPAGIVSD
jgi:hypothetical protein